MPGQYQLGLAGALVFLEINGYAVMGGEDELEAATREVASGNMNKDGFAGVLENIYKRYKRGA